MSTLMLQILESKRQMRAHLADRPISEKIAMLEHLRERHRLIASSVLLRSSPSGTVQPAGHHRAA